MDAVRELLTAEPRIAYALVFGSRARGAAHAGSDLDIAIGLEPSARFSTLELGDLIARLESASRCSVDLVLIREAPPAVAYRAFRDGQLILKNNHGVLVEDKTRAIIEYLDYQPIELLLSRGVLAAAAHGR